MDANTVSAISISIALLGISLHALVVKPYTGASYWTDSSKAKQHEWKKRIGKLANIMIIIGTAGQLYSLLI